MFTINKRIIARNVVWNWAGMAVTMLVGFVVAPFLIHSLGETRYGLWIVIASFTNYFGLLDLGIRASVGRQIAFHRAEGHTDKVNAILNTALGILSLAGLVALLATFGALLVFFHVFDVPAEMVGDVRLTLILVGLNLALWLPLNVFDATLWASQRFDVLNWIDIPSALLRAGLTFYFIGTGHGLVALALINLLSLAGGQALKAVVSFWLDPHLRLSLGHFGRTAAGSLFGYGVWSFLQSATRMVTVQVSPLLIGSLLGIHLVTLYSIAVRLLGYVNALLGSCTGVLAPIAASNQAGRNSADQRRLFLEGSKYCWALALFLLIPCGVLGRSLITLWVGPELEAAALLLAVLALGEVLPTSQLVTTSVLQGMARHRALAFLGLAENAIAISSAVVLAQFYGLLGVCIAFAVTGTLTRGVGQLLYGCRVIGVPLREYVVRSMFPPLAVAVVPGLFLAALVAWQVPGGWVEFFLYGAAYGTVYLAAAGFLVGYGNLVTRAAELFRAQFRVRAGEKVRS